MRPRAISTGQAGLAVLQAAQGQSKSAPAAHPPRNPEPYVRAALSACHQGSSSHRAASKSSRSQCVGEPASPRLGIAQLLHLCLALLAGCLHDACNRLRSPAVQYPIGS